MQYQAFKLYPTMKQDILKILAIHQYTEEYICNSTLKNN